MVIPHDVSRSRKLKGTAGCPFKSKFYLNLLVGWINPLFKGGPLKQLLSNSASNLVSKNSIHHNRFIGGTVNIPLFEALGPLYFIINKDFDDHIAPENIGGT